MPISKCSNGHYYDDLKYSACPHCGGSPDIGQGEDSKTVAMFSGELREGNQMGIRWPGVPQDEKTVSIYTSQMKADPVVGWLVGLNGPEKGRDYRLHTGRNFVGRSLRMDVLLADDDQVARENHCFIVYDPAATAFFVAPGEGTNTYINDRLLTAPCNLMDGDTVRLGGTELVFIAFCKGARKWL